MIDKKRNYKILTVSDDTWEEHNKVGIAAINAPPSIAKQQNAIAEISGIVPGDRLFFNRMASLKHPSEILGVFEATSEPYYDPSPLFPGAKYVKENLPFRIRFKPVRNFTKPIKMEDIWAHRGVEKFTLQRSRRDVEGNHACVGITRPEALIIKRLLEASNTVRTDVQSYLPTSVEKLPLPVNCSMDKPGKLHYEAALTAGILRGLAEGKYKQILGDYDDFIPYVATGAGKEIDLLLLKYDDNDKVLWYSILELKKDVFSVQEMQKLFYYEDWFKDNIAENRLQVHAVALAWDFDEDIRTFVSKCKDYRRSPIDLIKYHFNGEIVELEKVEVR